MLLGTSGDGNTGKQNSEERQFHDIHFYQSSSCSMLPAKSLHILVSLLDEPSFAFYHVNPSIRVICFTAGKAYFYFGYAKQLPVQI